MRRALCLVLAVLCVKSFSGLVFEKEIKLPSHGYKYEYANAYPVDDKYLFVTTAVDTFLTSGLFRIRYYGQLVSAEAAFLTPSFRMVFDDTAASYNLLGVSGLNDRILTLWNRFISTSETDKLIGKWYDYSGNRVGGDFEVYDYNQPDGASARRHFVFNKIIALDTSFVIAVDQDWSDSSGNFGKNILPVEISKNGRIKLYPALTSHEMTSANDVGTSALDMFKIGGKILVLWKYVHGGLFSYSYTELHGTLLPGKDTILDMASSLDGFRSLAFNDTLLAAWSSYPLTGGGFYSNYLKRYDSGMNQIDGTDDTTLSSPEWGLQGPLMAKSDAGILVAWRKYDSLFTGVAGQIYDDNLEKTGPEINISGDFPSSGEWYETHLLSLDSSFYMDWECDSANGFQKIAVALDPAGRQAGSGILFNNTIGSNSYFKITPSLFGRYVLVSSSMSTASKPYNADSIFSVHYLYSINNDISVEGAGGKAVNQTSLLPNFPNPFNPGTTLAFTVSEQDARSLKRAVLRIFDPRGRLVREFRCDGLKAGPHALKWDGTDRTGAPCAPGVFICRAAFGKKMLSNALVLMK